jgi:hypothetical protein
MKPMTRDAGKLSGKGIMTSWCGMKRREFGRLRDRKAETK